MAYDPQKAAKWLRWLDQIESDLIQLLGSRQIYRGYGEIVTGNPAILKGGPLFHNWVSENYVAHMALAIRRQSDLDSDTVSLARLIADIRDNPDSLTRSDHIAHYTNMPMGMGPGIGDQTFTENAGTGAYIDPAIAEQDLNHLCAVSLDVGQMANRTIAHRSTRQAPRLTFNDVDNNIEEIKVIARKYVLLLRAADNQLEPVMEDWQSIFYEKWIQDDN